MARFNQPPSNAPTRTKTYEGGAGFQPGNPLVELLFTAAVTYAGENTFYETSDKRSKRLNALVQDAIKRNPRQAGDIPRQLRQEFDIRTAAIQVACEYIAAGGVNGRRAIDDVCQRADEPGEVLAYWTATHGRKIHRSVKMGIGDAVRRLYTNEYNILKYDTPSKAFRFGDVIELCHVKPETPEQAKIFKYLLDERHHGDGLDKWDGDFSDLGKMLFLHHDLSNTHETARRSLLRENGFQMFANAGFTWERLSGWLPGGMDAEAWEAIIPVMGVIALTRNLRNFDQANISSAAIEQVIARLSNPEAVEKSHIFPYQVLLAYQYAPSDNWKRALNTTVDLASGNLPQLDNTLLVVDTSGSMQGALSARSSADRITVAGLQAASIARASKDCNVVIFGDTNRDITSDIRGRSVLGAAQYIHDAVGSVGNSTFGHTAIRDNFDPKKHKRVIMFTDDQMHDSTDPDERSRSLSWQYQQHRSFRAADISHVPMVVTFDVAGYGISSTYGKGRMRVAGFSDASFNAVAKLLNIEAVEPVGTTV